MKTELIIENSIIKVKNMGVKIVRGPMYIWGKESLPLACDCSGAVMIAHNKAYRDFPKGWLKELCIDILKKDTFWWWKFDFGFNRGRALEVKIPGCMQGEWGYTEDDVSASGYRLAKKFGLYNKNNSNLSRKDS